MQATLLKFVGFVGGANMNKAVPYKFETLTDVIKAIDPKAEILPDRFTTTGHGYDIIFARDTVFLSGKRWESARAHVVYDGKEFHVSYPSENSEQGIFYDTTKTLDGVYRILSHAYKQLTSRKSKKVLTGNQYTLTVRGARLVLRKGNIEYSPILNENPAIPGEFLRYADTFMYAPSPQRDAFIAKASKYKIIAELGKYSSFVRNAEALLYTAGKFGFEGNADLLEKRKVAYLWVPLDSPNSSLKLSGIFDFEANKATVFYFDPESSCVKKAEFGSLEAGLENLRILKENIPLEFTREEWQELIDWGHSFIVKVVKALRKKGIRFKKYNYTGKTVWAAQRGEIKVVIQFHEHKDTINRIPPQASISVGKYCIFLKFAAFAADTWTITWEGREEEIVQWVLEHL